MIDKNSLLEFYKNNKDAVELIEIMDSMNIPIHNIIHVINTYYY